MTRGPAPRRAAAERLGRRAEAWAGWLLRLKGYRVLERRWRGPVGEIDLVARRGSTLAVIEVKARPLAVAAAAAVDGRARRRLARAAAAFLAGRPDLAGLAVRFDVVLVVPGRLPRHLVDAWRPELEGGR
ncbi:MAG: YraN family protein [Alphaproteobacteria bacterium]|nr:YraN family protein [Alphaproteobacteria bacterium]